jgi:NhaA family Na+:H+ antiporter
LTDPDESAAAPRLRRYLIAPLQRFLEIEAASGILLLAATLAALAWVNTAGEATYVDVWSASPDLGWAGRIGGMTLHEFVNDALMAVFFFVVGLEIKLEWVQGSLADRRFARLPILAALGGMIVPALLYVVLTHDTAAGHGWGIPMATDIAFVVGLMAILGPRVPRPIRVFLLTLAIVDDLGSIVVIALFYAGGVQWGWLAAAVAGIVAMIGLRTVGLQRIWCYVLLGVPVWFATWQSGVHATIAGVAIAFCTPMQVRRAGDVWSPVGLLLDRLHPWSSFVVIPVFALANAGVMLSATGVPDAGRVVLGVAVGLVVGKGVGITAAVWLAVRSRAAQLPTGVAWPHVVGAALLAGIGFTMSLFITDLAFAGVEALALADAAKQGILAGSVTAAILGVATFVVAARRRGVGQG